MFGKAAQGQSVFGQAVQVQSERVPVQWQSMVTPNCIIVHYASAELDCMPGAFVAAAIDCASGSMETSLSMCFRLVPELHMFFGNSLRLNKARICDGAAMRMGMPECRT